MPFVCSSELDINTVDGAGVAITKYSNGQNHIAFLFTDPFENNSVKLMHVSSHKSLLVEPMLPLQKHYFWASLGCIPPLRKPSIIASLLHIASVNKGTEVRYGLDRGLFCFDPKTGLLNNNYTNQVGFTCATFVIEVLLSQGIKILDWGTWPPADDADKTFQTLVLTYLADMREKFPEKVTEDYLVAQNANFGNSRFKPQEVAVATQSMETSLFNDVVVPSQQLDEALHQRYVLQK